MQGGSSATSPASTIVLGGASGDATTLRSPDDFRRNLSELQTYLTRVKATKPSELSGKDEEQKKKQWQELHDRYERDLAFLREEYYAQIRLLELEVQDAESAVSSARQQYEAAQQQYKAGQTNRDNLLATERAIQESQIRLQRANTLLDLYRKTDPKSASADLASPERQPAAKQ